MKKSATITVSAKRIGLAGHARVFFPCCKLFERKRVRAEWKKMPWHGRHDDQGRKILLA